MLIMGEKIMTREELIEFLKNNLTIKVKHHNGQYDSNYESLEVILELCGEEISSDTGFLDE